MTMKGYVDPTTYGGPGMHYLWCDDCAQVHDRASRLPALRRMLPARASEILDAYPCRYLNGSATGYRRLLRDLRAMGAELKNGVWLFSSDLSTRDAQE